MPPVAAYDFAPVLELMLAGCAVAAVPLALWWRRHRGEGGARRLQALTLLTLFLTFDLVVFGAFTRLTDSGLGCPDWPGCYGQASPVGARAHIAAAQAVLPDGPVTHGKAWIEMVHRYLATGVGVLIIVLTFAAWRRWRSGARPAVHPAWPAATLAWVVVQGVFGAFTVTWKLFPAIVVLHLAGGLVLLVLLAVQAGQYAARLDGAAPVPVSRGLWRGLLACGALVAAQVLLGGWVSTNYAVLACPDFPTCQGRWWPAMDFAAGFQLWRPLGQLADGRYLGFDALVAMHYAHRLAAYAVVPALLLLAWRLARWPALARWGRWIALLAAWQAASGISNVVFDWPLLAALGHTAGAAALALVLTRAVVACRPAVLDGATPRPREARA